jgi:hypothetical protein
MSKQSDGGAISRPITSDKVRSAPLHRARRTMRDRLLRLPTSDDLSFLVGHRPLYALMNAAICACGIGAEQSAAHHQHRVGRHEHARQDHQRPRAGNAHCPLGVRVVRRL